MRILSFQLVMATHCSINKFNPSVNRGPGLLYGETQTMLHSQRHCYQPGHKILVILLSVCSASTYPIGKLSAPRRFEIYLGMVNSIHATEFGRDYYRGWLLLGGSIWRFFSVWGSVLWHYEWVFQPHIIIVQGYFHQNCHSCADLWSPVTESAHISQCTVLQNSSWEIFNWIFPFLTWNSWPTWWAWQHKTSHTRVSPVN